MSDIKLGYPIKLYMKKSFLLFAVIFSILMICVLYYGYQIAIERNDLYFVFMSGGSIVSFVFLILIFLAIWVLNQPTITINPSSIELFNLFKKNKKIFWSQVENIELDIWTHDSIKYWQLVIFPKQSYGKKIQYPLRTMSYNNMQFNEKEIFAIIEQSFKGERPNYKHIEMGLESRVDFGFNYFGVILTIGLLIFMLVISQF